MEAHSSSLGAKLTRAFSRAFAALFHADRRRAFVRELFYRLAARFTPGIVVESEGLRYVMSTEDHGAGMTLFMGEDVDHQTLERVMEGLGQAGLERPAGGTFIDVGANVGTTTVTALGAFGFARAVCFEPFPRNRDFLRLNLTANDLSERATILEVALSDRAGTVSFEVAPRNPGDARVRVEGEDAEVGAFGEEDWATIEVPTATLDSFLQSGAVDGDATGLLWIDAQGHEGHILAGAEALLAHRIPTVIEFWPYGLRRAGGLDRLLEIIEARFDRLLDLGDDSARVVSASEVVGLVDTYSGAAANTDLLLIP